MLKKISVVLTFILVLSNILSVFGSSNFNSDYKSHWANKELAQAIELGILKGYPDGTVRPDNNITRAEFFSLVNNAFGFTNISDIKFTDLEEKSWYYSIIQKAFAAGYIKGYADGTIRPQRNISRQEVAIIMSQIKSLESGVEEITFTDSSEIPDWSKHAIMAVNEAKIMNGYPDGSFKPNAPISRSEAIATIIRMLNKSPLIYDSTGTYGPNTDEEIVTSDVMICSQGVILQNLHIKGNLIIAEEVGDGDVTLKNIKVDGDTFVRGGGNDSIHIDGGSYNKIIVEQTSSDQTRIVGTNVDGLTIVLTEQAKGESIILEGLFKEVNIAASNINLKTQGNTTIQEIKAMPKAEGTKISLEKGTTVVNLTLEAQADIVGQGTIGKAYIKANNVTFEKVPEQQIIDSSVTVKPIITSAQTSNMMSENPNNNEGDETQTQSLYTIKGVISLPNEKVAPTGGLLVEIVADMYGTNRYSTLVRIPEGQNSTNYSIRVTEDSYNVGYCISNESFVSRAWYSINGTVTTYDPEMNYIRVSANVNNINLTLVEGYKVEGIISLPEGQKAPQGGLPITIIGPYAFQDMTTVIIPEGQDSTSYSIRLGKGKYYIGYYTSSSLYAPRGWYSTIGTVGSGSLATLIEINSTDLYNINMTLEEGNIISGTVSLPDKQKAPVGGLPVDLYVIDGLSSIKYITVVIPEGEVSVGYSVKLINGSYKIHYSIKNTSYLSLGWYSITGTVVNESSSTFIKVMSVNMDNINLMLIEGNIISGTISLPDNQLAPSGGLTVDISIKTDRSLEYPAMVTIPAGQNSISYILRIADGNYRIGYNTSSQNYITCGYYSESGMVAYLSSAKIINVASEDLSNINMTLIEGNIISGTISLPGDQVAPPGGVDVSIDIFSAGSWSEAYYRSVSIPAGHNSVKYELRVDKGNYIVEYWTWNTYYVSRGWYCKSSTSAQDDFATPIEVISTNIHNIDMTLIEGNIVSGTISLPKGQVAPSGGISVQIDAFHSDNGISRNYDSKNVLIPEGQNGVDYSLRLGEGSYKVEYYVSNEDYVLRGFYSETGVVGNEYSATYINVKSADINNINMMLLRGSTIRGTISLPEGQVALSGGISVYITISYENTGWFHPLSVTIPEGQNSIDYTLRVAGGNYKLGYHTSNESYSSRGWYSNLGTITDYWSATSINIDSADINNIDMTLIEGNIISGTISLPDNQLAPYGGLTVDISISTNRSMEYPKTVTIPAGQNSINYALIIADGNYKIGYHTSSEDYVSYGYYSESGTAANVSEATSIEVTSSDINNINITLVSGIKVSGIISLPEGQLAPKGGLSINICASGDSGAITEVKIPEGEASTHYSLRVAAENYVIGYNTPSGNYVEQGWYSDSGTVASYNLAKPISAIAEDVNNINITLIKGNIISGTLSLPNGVVAPKGGLEVYIFMNYGYGTGKTFIIPENQNSISYSLRLPAGCYTISYQSTTDSYVINGYYSESGTVGNESLATKVIVDSRDIDNINMTLMEGNLIKGTISLPEGKLAPNGGQSLDIFARGIMQGSGHYRRIKIPEGENSVNYWLRVADGSYIVGYHISNEFYMSDGYYSDSGTTIDATLATPLEVNSTNFDNINIQLISQ